MLKLSRTSACSMADRSTPCTFNTKITPATVETKEARAIQESRNWKQQVLGILKRTSSTAIIETVTSTANSRVGSSSRCDFISTAGRMMHAAPTELKASRDSLVLGECDKRARHVA